MFCENCGLQFLPMQSACTRCGVTCTRHWFQLMSLTALAIAAGCNSLVALLVLPHLAARHPHGLALGHENLAVRAWLWTDLNAAVWGWIPLALGLLAWDYFVRQESAPVISERLKGWLVRGLLILAIATGLAPIVPRWLRPPSAVLVTAARFPRLPALTAVSGLAWLLPWALVGIAAALICINAQTRDSLLGHGRVLSAVSLAILGGILIMVLLVFPA